MNKMPQDDYRRASGVYYNKRNDEKNEKDIQQVLNYIEFNSGNTITARGIRHPVGLLYAWTTLSAIAPTIDRPPQRISTSSTFEANTRIDLRSEGNQTSIHSFSSSSTVNHTRLHRRLQVPMLEHPMPATQPFIQQEPMKIANIVNSTNSIARFYPEPHVEAKANIAEAAHEFSISVHKTVHDIEELMNCTLTKRATQIKKWIFWGESIEQTHLRTVCQSAVAKAKNVNEKRTKQGSELHHFSFHSISNQSTSEPNHFNVNDSIEKIRKSFRACFEKRQSQNRNTTDKNSHAIDPNSNVTDTFWNGLSETVSQFLHQYEHTNYTKEQAVPNGGSAY